MKSTSKIFFLSIIIIIFFSSLYFYPFFITILPPQKLIKNQLAESALSPQSFWSQAFLNQNRAIKDKIIKFEKGLLCNHLRKLDTKTLTHHQISEQLKSFGYVCEVRPLSVNPKSAVLKYLKIDNTTTENPREHDVARQEICYERAQPDCVIRIKKDGFPLNRRSSPHSTKAVMLDMNSDPASYDNEAFKIGAGGQAIPKGPDIKFGRRECPYTENKQLCEQWVDLIMDQAHPILKEPIRMPSSLNP